MLRLAPDRPPDFLRAGFLLDDFLLEAFLLEAFFLAADFLAAGFVLTAAFFFAGAFFFDDERFWIARFLAGLRAGLFLAMPQVYQMFLSLRSNRQQLVLELKILLLSIRRSSAIVVPHCFIFLTEHHQKPITIPSRSHSAKLLVRRPCQLDPPFCFLLATAWRLARAQRKEAMGDRNSSSIRLIPFCKLAHFPTCKRPSLPAASAETTNRLARSRAINFIRAFILKKPSFLAIDLVVPHLQPATRKTTGPRCPACNTLISSVISRYIVSVRL